MRNQKGSVIAEFVLCFSVVFFAFFIVFQLVFLAIGREMTEYASFMALRSLKVNSTTNVQRVIKKIIPWAYLKEIEVTNNETSVRLKFSANAYKNAGYAKLLEKVTRFQIDSEIVRSLPEQKEFEDNPVN